MFLEKERKKKTKIEEVGVVVNMDGSYLEFMDS